ncbi:MAG: PAS domain-containing protein [Rhizobiales bacterium]|nr:PAS domain-containing protein [Hyphomicrobiales bacterium]
MGSLNAAFRAQLVLPEQRQLYDYWLEKSAGRGMPERGDLNPCEIARLLPSISLVDVDHTQGPFKFRLAGTRLRDIFDREITGLCFGDIDWGEKRDYWLSAFNWTAGEGKPTQGVLTGPRLHKEHLVQYWMKLPLGRIGEVGMLLCWDYCQAVADFPAEQAAAG